MEMVLPSVNKPNWIQWTSLVVVALLAVFALFMFMNMNNKVDDANNKIDNAVAKIPTASDIAKQISIPQAPALDTSQIIRVGGEVSKLCALTNDCAGCWDFAYDGSLVADNKVSTNSYRALKKAVESVTGIPYDEYDNFVVTKKDRWALATSCDEGDEGNYQVEIFYKIRYLEIDGNWFTDSETVYVSVIVNVEDNVDAEIVSVSQVDRNYEIVKPSTL